ncbi:MAG: aminotransferase class I/II-fold pyridoxal phosphate-dependent enzyme [Candidatus Omnitrophica bacterium]|nr:aminotransferase class I/II-fold pyridoxal phosphate-dependent enzyme [Candidatus Omnitrophota bacterium]
MFFSEKVSKVQPSATLSITSKAKAMKAEGEDVIILAAGEPDFDTPDIIKKAAIEAIKQGRTKYTPASGTKSLKEAICRKLNKDNGLKYESGQIVVSNGAKHSLYNALQVLCNPNDEVLIISPYWVSYPEMVKLAGAVPVTVKTRQKNGFKVSADDIAEAVTEKTKALIINSPSNPAGVVYDRDEIEKIADVCVSNDLAIISDEIYEKIIFDGKTHFSIASLSEQVKDRTVLVNGVSKSCSMTGWRIGYMAASKDLVNMVSTLQSHATSNPCSISQAAAECALTEDLDSEMEKNRQTFQDRRDVLVKRLTENPRLKPFVPEGAFYLFCDVSECGLDSLEFAKRLLKEKKVAVIPGGPFGEDGSIRISFATDMDTINKGVDRISEWVDGLAA